MVAGDLKAKSSYWGSSIADGKGEELESFAASLGLWTANSGDKSTLQKRPSSLVIDVTFIGPGPWDISGWTVLGVYSTSDHKYILFVLDDRRSHRNETISNGNVKWAFKKLDSHALERKNNEGSLPFPNGASADDSAEALQEYLTTLCDSCMPRITAGLKAGTLVDQKHS